MAHPVTVSGFDHIVLRIRDKPECSDSIEMCWGARSTAIA